MQLTPREPQGQTGAIGDSVLGRPLEVELPRTSEVMNARCCPACIEELGHIEAHWALSHMIACPVHKYLAISSCSACCKPLRWYRRGLLECSCGATLSVDKTRSATEHELTLLDVIRRKALSQPVSRVVPEGFPVQYLTRMTVPQLLETVDALARCQGVEGGHDKRRSIFLAAKLLSDWPNKFLQLLSPPDRTVTAHQSIRHLLRVHRMLCGPNDASRYHTNFIGAVIVEFALNRWAYRHSQTERYKSHLPTGLCGNVRAEEHRAKLANQLNTSPPETESALEAAGQLGCSPTAIPGLIQSGKVSGTVFASSWRVELPSLDSFRDQYLFIIKMAASENSSEKILLSLCRTNGISVFLPPAERLSGRQPYIRQIDAERLKAALTKRRARRAAK